MPLNNPGTVSNNRLTASGTFDPSASQTTIQLEYGRIVAIPTALLIEQPATNMREPEERYPSPDLPTIIPVIAEEMVITKRLVPLETVRLVKSSEPRTERVEVPISKERWEVTRVPVAAEVAERSEMRQNGDTAIYPVYEERLMTRKAIILVEEIHVRKVIEVTNEVVESSLQHEVLTVERVSR